MKEKIYFLDKFNNFVDQKDAYKILIQKFDKDDNFVEESISYNPNIEIKKEKISDERIKSKMDELNLKYSDDDFK